MLLPPTPLRETERLRALHDTGVLDTAPEAFFDEITALASEVCGMPIALVSLVDTTRQWFKSAHGLPVRETPRAISFCGHAICDPDKVMVVEDAREDPRFSDNPLVMGDPSLRFYAGAPLVDASGHALGTLCVADREPHAWSPAQDRALRALARAVAAQLDARRTANELERALEARARSQTTLHAQRAVLGVLAQTGAPSRSAVEIVRALGMELGLEAADLWLSPEGKAPPLRMGTWSHVTGAHGRKTRGPEAGTLVLRAFLTGRLQTSQREPESTEDVRLAIPVLGERRTLGVFELWLRASAHADDLFIEGLESLCQQLGLALEREITAQRLEAGEAWSRTLVEAALDCIVACDRQGRITEFNPAAERTLGWRREDVLGKDLAEVIVPESQRAAHKAGMQRVVATGESRMIGKRLELRALRADGTEIPVELTVMRMPNGHAIDFTAFLRDITDRRRHQDAMLRAKEAAENASRAKSDFLAVVSHEIRTPMNAILGMTELALETSTDANVRELMATAHSSAESLLVIVNEILDQSKLEAGQMEIVPRASSVDEIVDAVLETLGPRTLRKGLRLGAHVAAHVPARLMLDPTRFRQVLLNLAGNAVKFTAKGEVVLRVDTRRDDDGNERLLVTVRDTGIGIAPDALEKVFDRYYQAGAPGARDTSGTGLGLSISRALVLLMGGRIWAESTLGEGATFSFEVPLVRADESEPPRPFDGVRAVVVAPEGPAAERLCNVLVRLGCTCSQQTPGSTASPSVPPAVVVLSDDLSGTDLHAVMNTWSTQPVVPVRVDLGSGHPEAIVRSETRATLGGVVTAHKLGNTLARLRGAVTARPDSIRPSTPVRTASILLVDDNVDNLAVAGRMLARAGHRVESYTEAMEALLRTQLKHFDLVITDVDMPRMDGIEFARRLQAQEDACGIPRTPVLALTAHALPSVRDATAAAGMVGHLTKPIARETLLSAVREHADLRPAVLVVDDSPDMRELVRRYLASPTLRVECCESGEAALGILSRCDVCVVLLDMSMPGMDGYETVRRIRTLPSGPGMQVIAMTGFEGEEERRRCEEAGCSSFLAKPFRRDDLHRVVENALLARQAS